MSASIHPNPFLSDPLGKLYVRTGAPMMVIMAMGGFMTLADAYFLGVFVGPEALTAVTLMFPLYMMLAAMMTLVGSGMASQLARALGAGDIGSARRIFAGAHGLALALCGVSGLAFLAFGTALTMWVARGDPNLAGMGHTYMAILVAASPVAFFLAVNSDALRSEGRAGLSAMISVFASVANLGLNYVLIAFMGWGVAGSAYGTVAAQVLALAIVAGFRIRSRSVLAAGLARPRDWLRGWSTTVALGAPQSLSFLGISLGSAAIIYSLQVWSGDNYPVVVAAYGIVTRIMTFLYLPMLAFALAMQTITGSNLGARLFDRSNASLRMALALVFAYCVAVELLILMFRDRLGAVFVNDAATIVAVARIAPILVLVYPLAGASMMLGGHFQASGEAGRAALLTLPRTYLFSMPLILSLPFLLGEPGIWYAAPLADVCMLAVVLVVLMRSAGATGRLYGLFHRP